MQESMVRKSAFSSFHTPRIDQFMEKAKRTYTQERIAEIVLAVITVLLSGVLIFSVLKAFLNYTIHP